MGTWIVLVIVVVVAAALFALAWWTSGRGKAGGPRMNMRGASRAQAEGTFQASLHSDPPGGSNTM